MRRENRGGGGTSPSPSPSLKNLDLGGGVCPPPPLCHHLAAHRACSLSLYPSPCLLVEGMVLLPPCRILGQVGIPWFIAAAPKTMCKATSVMKR
jgi:hypothetical protein